MPNREERRARARRERRSGSPRSSAPVAPRGSGRVNEYDLQERSRRLAEGSAGPWVPSASDAEQWGDEPPTASHRSAAWWARVVCWSLIALSVVAFLVAMWLPSHPLWLLIVVAVAFAIGILSLFFVSRDPSSNPRLDDNGTAV